LIKKIASLKGHIDCPFCFSYLEWNDINDIQVFNGNKYIVCPECGKNVYLNDKKDYWDTSGGVLPDITEEDEGKILKVVNGVWSKADNDSSEETWVTVFEGEVTTKGSNPVPTAGLTLSEPLTATNIRVTFNGQVYEYAKQTSPYTHYGTDFVAPSVDWSTYPFSVAEYSHGVWHLATESPGTYTVKIEADNRS